MRLKCHRPRLGISRDLLYEIGKGPQLLSFRLHSPRPGAECRGVANRSGGARDQSVCRHVLIVQIGPDGDVGPTDGPPRIACK